MTVTLTLLVDGSLNNHLHSRVVVSVMTTFLLQLLNDEVALSLQSLEKRGKVFLPADFLQRLPFLMTWLDSRAGSSHPSLPGSMADSKYIGENQSLGCLMWQLGIYMPMNICL